MATTVSDVDDTYAAASKAGGTAAEAQGFPPARVAWYAIFVLACSVCFAQLDLQIVGLLLMPIKKDLGLTDVQVSVLVGFAFAVFYTFIGLPVARYIDRNKRTAILAIGIAVWSVATAFCGITQNFWQFFLSRVMVGAGESVNGPATYSLIADYFPNHRLPRAIATMQIGVVVGGGISMLLNAFLIYKLQGMEPIQVPVIGLIRWWQIIFITVGLPGLVIAWLMTTVPEPPRRGLLEVQRNISMREVLGYIFVTKFPVFGPQFLSLTVGALAMGGLQWMPAFYQRTYHWNLGQIAVFSGLSQMVTMLVGLFLGVKLSEWLTSKGDNAAYLRVVVWLRLIGLPASVCAPLMPNGYLAFACGAIGFMIIAAAGAPLNAAMQVVTPNQMRGQINALYLFVYSVIGTGVGPTVIAMITQYLFQDEAQLRYALVTNSLLFNPLALLILWLGVAPYGREVARLKEVRGETANA